MAKRITPDEEVSAEAGERRVFTPEFLALVERFERGAVATYGEAKAIRAVKRSLAKAIARPPCTTGLGMLGEIQAAIAVLVAAESKLRDAILELDIEEGT